MAADAGPRGVGDAHASSAGAVRYGDHPRRQLLPLGDGEHSRPALEDRVGGSLRTARHTILCSAWQSRFRLGKRRWRASRDHVLADQSDVAHARHALHIYSRPGAVLRAEYQYPVHAPDALAHGGTGEEQGTLEGGLRSPPDLRRESGTL